MQKVVRIIASEAGSKLEILRRGVNRTEALELIELLALHEQITGTAPEFINETQLARTLFLNGLWDDEDFGDATLLAAEEQYNGSNPDTHQIAEAA